MRAELNNTGPYPLWKNSNHELYTASIVDFVNLSSALNQSILTPNFVTKQLNKSLTAWICFNTILTTVGACANLIILVAVFLRKEMRSGSQILIGHLTLIYFIHCVAHYPIGIIMVAAKEYQLSIYLDCQYVNLFYVSCVTAGNWADATLAINRFVAICFPHYYKPLTSKTAIGIMVTFCWACGFGQALAMFFDVGGKVLKTGLGHCVYNQQTTAGSVLIAVLGTYFAYSIIGAASLVIFGKMVLISMRQKIRIGVSGARVGDLRNRQVLHRRLAIGRMLLVSFLWCLMCNSPPVVVSSFFIYVFLGNPVIGLWLRTCLNIQFALNPFIFYGMNRDYRSGLRGLMRSFRRLSPVGVITKSSVSQPTSK